MEKFKPMPPTSKEVMERLSDIHQAITAHEDEIDVLKKEADSLVTKYTFEECRAMGCVHTCRKQFWCDHYRWCIHSKHASGASEDFFERKEAKVYIPQKYPMLGWKAVVCEGSNWRGEWHPRKVLKETDRTLIIEYGKESQQLLKSTAFQIEDVTYIKDRSGYTYFCADDPSTLDMQRDLLHIAWEEKREKNAALMAPVLKSLEDPFADDNSEGGTNG